MSGSSPKSISISGVETDITIGKELAAVAQKSKALASRDCFEQLEDVPPRQKSVTACVCSLACSRLEKTPCSVRPLAE